MSIVATVFIVDDDEAVRDSIKELVASVGLAADTYASAVDFLATYDAARPGCLVLDIRMARMSGLALQTKLNEMGATLPIVFITAHADVPTAVDAMRAGALSFVTKPYREQELLDSINEALARDAAARSIAKEDSRYAASLDALTEREREVLDLAVTGLPSKVIAQQLGISYRTVELHRSRILEKLGAGSMVELIRIAAERRG
jgi:FixJ family two-component response regulator